MDRPVIGLAAVLAVAYVGGAALAAAVDYEGTPVLRAADVAPAKLLGGQDFQVDEKVATDGFLARFHLRSEYGALTAEGVELLEVRVAEIASLRALEDTSRTEEFAKALGGAALRPLRSAANMAANPAETIQGIPEGVGRFFERVELGAKALQESAGDPSKDVSARSADTAKRAGAITADAFGYEQEGRRIAKELRADPYTTNPILSERMSQLASAALAGRVGVNTVVTLLVPASIVLTATSVTNDLVWDLKPADLLKRNQERLAAIGIGGAEAQRFLANHAWSLTVQTHLVDALERLDGARNRREIVALASTADGDARARLIAASVRMLADHHQRAARIEEVLPGGPVLGRTKSGEIVATAALDYVPWNERVDRFARRADLAAKQRSVWITGRFSERARSELGREGWQVHDGTRSR